MGCPRTQLVSIRHQPEYLPSPLSTGAGGRRQVVSIRHQPEYLPSPSDTNDGRRPVARNVSIRHQPEYLPSHVAQASSLSAWRVADPFQSGISLSICLHTTLLGSEVSSATELSFQSGISLSICLHDDEASYNNELSRTTLSFNQASA